MRIQGPGVNQIGGAIGFGGAQLGFPAKITSSHSSTEGYSWEELTVAVGTGVTAASPPRTGAHAHDLNGSTSIALNTIVWLEKAGNGQGYVIVQEGGAAASSPSISSSQTSLALSFDITSNNTWTSTSATVSLPSAGTYFLFGRISASISMTAIGTSNGVTARLNDGSGAILATPILFVTATDTVSTPWHVGAASFGVVYTAASSVTVTLQVQRINVGATYSICRVNGGSGDNGTHIGYLKIA